MRQLWSQQVAPQTTCGQIIFDVVFGILAPVLCLVLDPIIFRTLSGGLGYLGAYQVFVYLAVAIGVLTLATWLSFGSKLDLWNGFIAGILLAGAVVAFALGIWLLPSSLLFGFLCLVGFLGLIPFLTSFVFLRNGIMALAQTNRVMEPARLLALLLAGTIFAIGIPAVADWQASRFVSNSVQTIIQGEPQVAQQATRELRSAFWYSLGCFDPIVSAYQNEQDQARRVILANAYLEITGNDIESRVLALRWRD